jgi:hypothetical protein
VSTWRPQSNHVRAISFTGGLLLQTSTRAVLRVELMRCGCYTIIAHELSEASI